MNKDTVMDFILYMMNFCIIQSYLSQIKTTNLRPLKIPKKAKYRSEYFCKFAKKLNLLIPVSTAVLTPFYTKKQKKIR